MHKNTLEHFQVGQVALSLMSASARDDLKSLKVYLRIRNKLLGQVRALETDRQTDPTEHITALHSRVVKFFVGDHL